MEPPTDEMRVSLDDPDFKEWLGQTIGTITNQAVDLTGDVGDSVSKVLAAIGAGVKGESSFIIVTLTLNYFHQEIEWDRFVEDVGTMAGDLWEKFSSMFASDG